ncbi:MAG TPA: phenylalanine--tRNA ligase subunit alpha [Gemmatimonadaceae bacterium]|nr:phenylalanine--tRNA ligase subunit alpha [Gemmatimonadaceae bacterium]
MPLPEHPSLGDYTTQIGQVAAEGVAAFAAAGDLEALDAARIAYLGDRRGRILEFQRALGKLPKEAKPEAGKLFNAARNQLEAALAERRDALARVGARYTPPADLTMPARHTWKGGRHPVTLVIEEIAAIFRELGFTIALGPEVETEWYNFGALNFPADHPAMELHDTLYLREDVLLRTHTSPVQVRTLQRYAPPLRILAPGNVYRRDFFDASHAPMFAQVEGLCVDEGVSFVDLKATLAHFARRFFGTARVRFRPSFFPFTEPSAEMDIECQLCHGAGCPACKGTGWMEILGSGMVHPAVLDAAGVDSEQFTGWAFGMGPARIAQQRYGVGDIRVFYDSDVRFLEQLA